MLSLRPPELSQIPFAKLAVPRQLLLDLVQPAFQDVQLAPNDGYFDGEPPVLRVWKRWAFPF